MMYFLYLSLLGYIDLCVCINMGERGRRGREKEKERERETEREEGRGMEERGWEGWGGRRMRPHI